MVSTGIMTNAAPNFQALFRSLDFERPLDVSDPQDEALYVENLHTSDGYSPLDDLQANIEMSDRPGTWLFTGHRGVGKSTELRRMADRLRKSGHVVLVVDMMDYLNMAEPLHIEGLLLNMAAALADEAEQMLPSMHGMSSGPVARLWSFLKNTDISLPELNAEASVGDANLAQAKLSLKTEFKRHPDLRQKVLDAVKNAPGKLAEQVRQFAREVAQGAQDKQGAGTRVVLILDSLERLRVTGADAQVCYDAIARTFDSHGEHLKLEHIDVVYSVPPYLPFLSPRIGSYFGVEVCTLPHVKVFKTPPDSASTQAAVPCDTGVALLVACVSRRYPDVQQLIPLTQLQRLALASSGSVRDFFRLIRSVCTKAHAARVSPPLDSDRWVQLAEQMLLNEMPLAEADKQWLAEVRKTHGTGLASMDNLHELARLFDCGLILNYRNGRDWCDVQYLLHPQITPS
ncbi:MAG: hypothetical protein RLZZ352_893 [Pseudomonadota bacterium]|jgi:hypothetical protein